MEPDQIRICEGNKRAPAVTVVSLYTLTVVFAQCLRCFGVHFSSLRPESYVLKACLQCTALKHVLMTLPNDLSVTRPRCARGCCAPYSRALCVILRRFDSRLTLLQPLMAAWLCMRKDGHSDIASPFGATAGIRALPAADGAGRLWLPGSTKP